MVNTYTTLLSPDDEDRVQLKEGEPLIDTGFPDLAIIFGHYGPTSQPKKQKS